LKKKKKREDRWITLLFLNRYFSMRIRLVIV
jgi:hypothetical protein